MGDHRIVKSVQAFANTICGDLPEGYVITLSFENGAAWVVLELPEGAYESIEPEDEPMAIQIVRAVTRARDHHGAGESL